MRAVARGLVCLSAWLLPVLVEAAGSVYRWTDAQGVVHYDDQSRLQERLTRATIARGPVAAEPSATVPADLVAEVRRRCIDLRERASSMRSAATLYGQDPAGNVYRLSPRQTALALIEADRDQQRYCHPEAPRHFYREALERGRREQAEAQKLARAADARPAPEDVRP